MFRRGQSGERPVQVFAIDWFGKGIGKGQSAWALDGLQKMYFETSYKIIEDALIAWMLVQDPDWAGKDYREPGNRRWRGLRLEK